METNESRQVNLTDVSDSIYLECTELHFSEHGTALHLTVANDVSWLNVRLTSLFPLSAADTYVCVYDCEETELGILKTLADLAVDSRRIVSRRLRSCYLLPVVRRIVAVKERFGTLEWQVETDLGRRSFTTRNTRETTTQISANRMLLCDVDGNRYEVREFRDLDALSRTYLSRYL